MSQLSTCPHVYNSRLNKWDDILNRRQIKQCDVCDAGGPNLWICLHNHCLAVLCGEGGQDHGTKHGEEMDHHLSMNMTSLRIWCYRCECEVFRDNNQPPFPASMHSRSIVNVSGSPVRDRRSSVSHRHHSPGGDSRNSLSPEASSSEDDESDESLKPRGLTGLQNIGNTCYMNSALQALSNCPPLTRFFLDCGGFVRTEKKPMLCKSYQRLMQEMWHRRRPPYLTPSSVASGVRIVHPMFRGYAQQDAQEFLRCFMDQLHEELKQPDVSAPAVAVLEQAEDVNTDDGSDVTSGAAVAALDHVSSAAGSVVKEMEPLLTRNSAASNKKIFVDAVSGYDQQQQQQRASDDDDDDDYETCESSLFSDRSSSSMETSMSSCDDTTSNHSATKPSSAADVNGRFRSPERSGRIATVDVPDKQDMTSERSENRDNAAGIRDIHTNAHSQTIDDALSSENEVMARETESSSSLELVESHVSSSSPTLERSGTLTSLDSGIESAAGGEAVRCSRKSHQQNATQKNASQKVAKEAANFAQKKSKRSSSSSSRTSHENLLSDLNGCTVAPVHRANRRSTTAPAVDTCRSPAVDTCRSSAHSQSTPQLNAVDPARESYKSGCPSDNTRSKSRRHCGGENVSNTPNAESEVRDAATRGSSPVRTNALSNHSGSTLAQSCPDMTSESPQQQSLPQSTAAEQTSSNATSAGMKQNTDVIDGHATSHVAKNTAQGPAKKAKPKKPVKYHSVISDVFDGRLLSSVQCLTCERISSTKETFQDLSLPIPTRDHVRMLKTQPQTLNQKHVCGEVATQHQQWFSWMFGWMRNWFWGPNITLQNCLAAFFSADELKGDNMYSCERCKKLRNGMKYSKVLQLPEILCIHLKRFRHEFMFSSKISTFVSFPIEGLDMRPYLHKDCADRVTQYDLIGTICHHGSAGGYGHYTSYALNDRSMQWFEFDDQLVTEVDLQQVVNCEAYVLFYRKKNDDMLGERKRATDLIRFNESSFMKFWISRQWINKFNTFAEPGPISNHDFICQHGGVYPQVWTNVNALAMEVPQQLWQYCHDKYGGGPAVTYLHQCSTCLEELDKLRRRQVYEHDTFSDLRDEFDASESRGVIYAISMLWFREWENFVFAKTNEPPNAIDNSRICITKQGVSVLRHNADAGHLSEEMWQFLVDIYGGGPEIITRQAVENE